MADVKISALPPATTIAAADELAVVQGGTTKKVAFSVLSNTINNAVPVTLTQLDALIAGSTLVPGTTYKISGFNKNMPSGGPGNLNGYLPIVLYDDGTNSGITIYMQALTTTTMATSGYGEFYNPKYGDGSTYLNIDGTGLYRIWDGDNPDPGSVPAYAAGDVVFWGGYAWENTSGLPGFDVDILTLSNADWVKLPYSNTTWYELVIDEIKVDWDNKILIERYNPEASVKVSFATEDYSWSSLYGNIQCSPISVMAWGLYGKNSPTNPVFGGMVNVQVINSYFETVCFKGNNMENVILEYSKMEDNYFGKDSSLTRTDLTIAFISNNYFENSSYAGNYTSINNGSISNCTFKSSGIDGVFIQAGYIGFCDLDNSYIYACSITNYSYINDNSLVDSNIYDCSLTNESRFQLNLLDNSFIKYNSLNNGSFIDLNNLTGSSIEYNTLLNQSQITDNILIDSGIEKNTLDYSEIVANDVQNFSYIAQNSLHGQSELSYNIQDNASNITRNVLTVKSLIHVNNLTGGATILDNTLRKESQIFNNVSSSATITGNECDYSYIEENNLIGGNSEISNNILKNGNIYQNTFDQSLISITKIIGANFDANNMLFCQMVYIVMNPFSQIINGNFNSFNIEFCTLQNSTWDFSANPLLSSSTLTNIIANTAGITLDISSATFIYGVWTKQLFVNSGAVQRMSYYDNTDTLTVVNIDA